MGRSSIASFLGESEGPFYFSFEESGVDESPLSADTVVFGVDAGFKTALGFSSVSMISHLIIPIRHPA